MLRSLLCLLVLIIAPARSLADKPAISFRNEVMAVLSRAGCNSGACHGNLNGKGGFKLSLRGENTEADYHSITRGTLGRRIDILRPQESLLLAKATMTSPHEGGVRFGRDSGEYEILRRWIAGGGKLDREDRPTPTRLEVLWTSGDQQGTNDRPVILHAPKEQLVLQVKATFSDSRSQDITGLACFEPSSLLVKVNSRGVVRRESYGEATILVRYLHLQSVVTVIFVPQRPPFTWREPAADNYIDRHVLAKLRLLRVEPSEICSDTEFLRRAYLDTLGMLPTPEETRSFLTDSKPHKRKRLIGELLRRNEFADFWALKWSDLLRNEEKVLDNRGVAAFHAWIRRAMLEDRPLNEFARDLIASRGSTYSHPAANYYRALREPYARAEATAQVFLGIRLQCAKCHNHPFDRWTQTDYHRFAAFFARVDYRILENNRRDRLDMHEFAGEQIVFMNRVGELKDPVSGNALHPRFLGADLPAGADRRDRLVQLADWVAARDNLYFARAQANRIWQHLLGRGLVDPGDDFRESNPASHPELLEELAQDLAKHGFSLRHLISQIMNSRTYQRAAKPTPSNNDDEINFARSIVRPLQAEQLFDAVGSVCGTRLRFAGLPSGTRAGQLPGVVAPRRRRDGPQNGGEQFLAVFGKPVRSLNCECERGEDTTLAQAFQLLTGETIEKMLTAPNNRIGKMLEAGHKVEEIAEVLYLAALCRYPTALEMNGVKRLATNSRTPREALEDLASGLINSKEFLLRR